MKRATTLLLISLFFSVASGAAAPETPRDVNPGVIGPDHPLYSIDLAVDDTLQRIGVKPPGEIAHERASEAFVAAEANLTEARDRALTALNRTVGQANGLRDGTGLENAQALLTELQETAPAEAQDGLQDALDAVSEAKNRFPTDLGPSGPTEVPE
ncbi:hypothetical protein [Halorarum salinum]|uniref:DUF5667 domain-containing protein n=1 Tax=Halorarum salinum TaxID=2743089 RepID=A0A7D5LAL0_9EURY|nr:hypothetical protein [Halobaculum salinum]QLG62008.1 hypothetical protein HUG12_09845 [Halobaculum salinum]